MSMKHSDKPIKGNLTVSDLCYLLAAGRVALKRLRHSPPQIREPLLRAVRRAANTVRNA